MKSTKKRSPSLAQRAAAVPLGWPPAHLLTQSRQFRRKVVFDLHGPILDFATPFVEFYCQMNGVQPNIEQLLAAAKYYDMGFDPNNPVTSGKFAQAFRDFARMARGTGYGHLPVRPGTKDTFQALEDAGIDFEIWTWVPGASEYDGSLRPFGTGIAQKATLDLIASLGICKDVERQVKFVRPGDKVSRLITDHIPMIVEDNPTTAVEAGYTKAQACLVTPEPYNEHLAAPGILRLSDHSEIAPAIIGFFQELDKAGALLSPRR